MTMVASVWPKISFALPSEEFNKHFQEGAVSCDAVLLEDLDFQAPWADIKRLHDLLSSRPDLRERLNSAQPKEKPNYKTAAVDSAANKNPGALIDQKVSLDLSAKRMADLAESGVDILELLGQSFQSIVDFYRRIEGGLVPRTMKALSGLVDDGLDAIHRDSAFTLRLSSYFPRTAGATPAPRCGEHKDFGTFTLLFQDPEQPGLELFTNGAWHAVPTGCCLVTFGWCAQIRSNDRVKAVLHQVRDGAAGPDGVVPRRDAAIFFVAPDVSAPLETIVQEGEVPQYAGVLTHGEFKAKMARKWQEREGTVEAGLDTMTQEDIVKDFLRAPAKRAADARLPSSADKETMDYAAVPAACA